MSTSIFLAQFIGIFSLVMGLSMLAKRKMLISIFHEISDSRALSYIIGVFIFLMGLLIVLNHTIWGNTWSVIITLIGWGILLEGLVYLFISKERLVQYLHLLNRKRIYYFIASAYIFLSLHLIYFGFLFEH